jgi:hypothetical protein
VPAMSPEIIRTIIMVRQRNALEDLQVFIFIVR